MLLTTVVRDDGGAPDPTVTPAPDPSPAVPPPSAPPVVTIIGPAAAAPFYTPPSVAPSDYVSPEQQAALLAQLYESGAPLPPDVVPTSSLYPPPPASGDGTPPQPPDDSLDDDPDAEAGDEPTAADYAQFEDERVAIESGLRTLEASTHPPAGTLIGLPYEGTHSVAFNKAGGSDNWQSENAVDVWLWPGTAILAVADGVISPGGYGFGMSNEGGRFAGWRVHLITHDGRAFFYTHMAGLDVVKGQSVTAGQKIGDSGIANGVPHLHFAARPPFDPRAYYKAAFSLTATTSIGASPTTGSPVDVKDAGVLDAWNELMIVHGQTVPAATTHIRDARQQLSAAVS